MEQIWGSVSLPSPNPACTYDGNVTLPSQPLSVWSQGSVWRPKLSGLPRQVAAHWCSPTVATTLPLYLPPLPGPTFPGGIRIQINTLHWCFKQTSAGNLFKIIFRVSAERVQALPINLRYIYKRVFHNKYCIRLCHQNKIDLLTYLLAGSHDIQFGGWLKISC